MTAPSSCSSCGAALTPGATQCDLCGTPIDEGREVDPGPSAETSTPPPRSSPPANGPVTCSVCSHLNPAGSRFCNQCGATLAAGPVGAPDKRSEVEVALLGVEGPDVSGSGEPGERPPSDPGRRALLYVGVGLAAVIGLYLLTQASQGSGPDPETPAVAEQPRLTAAPAALPDSLDERVSRLEDEGTAQSFDQAGGLLYRAAAVLPPEDPQRATLAQRAVDLYDRSLALEEDPDVRVNLAVAALMDPRNPMRAVQELQAVLNADPDHVEANFNMGLMRMQIGRLDAASASFERVLSLTPPGDPVHQRATEALAALEGAMSQQGAGG